MSDLLRDVDDMMRQDRLMQIWNRYGNWLIAGVLSVIVAAALAQGYTALSHARAQRHTDALLEAFTGPDNTMALEKFASETGGSSGTAARILAARELLADGKNDAAIKILLAARSDASANRDLRDLATLLWARAMTDDKTAKADDLLNALGPLMQDEGLPYYFTARLDAAVIAANLKQDYTAAQEYLAPLIGNSGLPRTQSERALALSQAYKMRAAEKADAK